MRRIAEPVFYLLAFVIVAHGFFSFWSERHRQILSWDMVYATPLTERVSPDGNWKAYIDQIIHRDYDHWVLQGADTVFLMDMQNPSDVVPVLSVTDDAWADNVFPVLNWTAPDYLQIAVAETSFVNRIRQDYKGVRIELCAHPDDPAARDAGHKRSDHAALWPRQPGIAPPAALSPAAAPPAPCSGPAH